MNPSNETTIARCAGSGAPRETRPGEVYDRSTIGPRAKAPFCWDCNRRDNRRERNRFLPLGGIIAALVLAGSVGLVHF